MHCISIRSPVPRFSTQINTDIQYTREAGRQYKIEFEQFSRWKFYSENSYYHFKSYNCFCSKASLAKIDAFCQKKVIINHVHMQEIKREQRKTTETFRAVESLCTFIGAS